MALEIGTNLGPYRVLEKLGAGGVGEVYRMLAASLFGDRLEFSDRLEVFDTTHSTFDLDQAFERQAATFNTECGNGLRI